MENIKIESQNIIKIKGVNEMIYMNDRATNFENIFDAVNPGRPDLWYTVSSKETGRPISEILEDWVNNKKTYYYLNGIKTIFESK